jgi:hypothetical protein
MRRDRILDLLVLEADGGLSSTDAVRLEEALAEDPALQDERVATHAAWRELRTPGSGAAMPRDSDDDEDAASVDAESSELTTTAARRAPTPRDHAPAPARRQRRAPRKRR